MQEEIDELILKGVEKDIICQRFSDEGWVTKPVYVPAEMHITIFVNSQELVTIMCTPIKLNCLVIGFLYAEGIISDLSDVMSMRVCEEETTADVRLSNSEYQLPILKKTLTSGCGGGSAFKNRGEKVDSDMVIKPDDALFLMKELLEHMDLYRLCGGVHASALADRRDLLIVAEDIGRHNTFYKIQGECLLRGISTKDRLLLSTGRVSSEMLLKAAGMHIPIVISRTSPTGRGISLARGLGITLVGYARGKRLSVYSHPERLGCSTN